MEFDDVKELRCPETGGLLGKMQAFTLQSVGETPSVRENLLELACRKCRRLHRFDLTGEFVETVDDEARCDPAAGEPVEAHRV